MKQKGNYGEKLARNFLIHGGFEIIVSNFYTRFGELDIIAKRGQHIHIVEVKLLAKKYIHSGYKINFKKQRRMIQTTQVFMDHYKLYDFYYQFDLVTIISGQIKHYKNIFTS